MKPSLILCLLVLLSACGAPQKSLIKMGQTTRSDLIGLKGEPLQVDTIPIPEGSVLIYEDDERYQVEGEVVTNAFKRPVGDERLVLYWKHKFKDCLTSSNKLKQDSKSHIPAEIEFACVEQGLSVIYTDGSEHVNRVVEYEKK